MSENEGDKIKVDTISTKDEEVTLSLEVETAKNQTQTPPIENPPAPKPVHRTSSYGNQGGGNNRNSSNNPNRFNKRNQEYEEKLVNVARVTTVVKGGRRFSFSVIVVIGNRKGKVGYGHGKANEVPDAIKKAIKDAQRNLINVPIVKGGTIPHVSEAKFVASKVLLKPAQKGRGLIASGSVRAVIELAGYKDIVTKSIGSSNKTNVVKATLKALQQLSLPEDIARLRDVSMSSFAGQK